MSGPLPPSPPTTFGAPSPKEELHQGETPPTSPLGSWVGGMPGACGGGLRLAAVSCPDQPSRAPTVTADSPLSLLCLAAGGGFSSPTAAGGWPGRLQRPVPQLFSWAPLPFSSSCQTPGLENYYFMNLSKPPEPWAPPKSSMLHGPAAQNELTTSRLRD